MLKKRIIISLTFLDGVLFRTKKFIPDYRYTKNFVGLWSIDEIILTDISKKKFSNEFINIISFFSSNCFVPISVGGGISTIEHADEYFKIGADKIILGSKSIQNVKIISEIAMKYGSQSIIQSIDIKKDDNSKYKLAINSGLIMTETDPKEAIEIGLKNGAGEILINNVDFDGSLLGYDLEVIKNLTKNYNCQFLALGGAGNWEHMAKLLKETDVSAACSQNIFHFTDESISAAKNYLKKKDILVRT